MLAISIPMYANTHAYFTKFTFSLFIKYTFTPSIAVPQITCHSMLCPYPLVIYFLIRLHREFGMKQQ